MRIIAYGSVWYPIETGEAALWTAGEEHTTRADEPLVAIVVETPQVPAGD